MVAVSLALVLNLHHPYLARKKKALYVLKYSDFEAVQLEYKWEESLLGTIMTLSRPQNDEIGFTLRGADIKKTKQKTLTIFNHRSLSAQRPSVFSCLSSKVCSEMRIRLMCVETQRDGCNLRLGSG